MAKKQIICTYMFISFQKAAEDGKPLSAGMDVKSLSSILGHAQNSTILNLYAYVLPKHKQASMEKCAASTAQVLKPKQN